MQVDGFSANSMSRWSECCLGDVALVPNGIFKLYFYGCALVQILMEISCYFLDKNCTNIHVDSYQ